MERKVDIFQAEQFLPLFEGRITFQTFDDTARNKNLAQIIHSTDDGDWSHIQQRLVKGNSLGAGIFFAVNETDGKGRKKELRYYN